MWRTSPHKINGNEIDGKPIALLKGMNWWFAWGRKEFDIRNASAILDRKIPKAVTTGHYCSRSTSCRKWLDVWLARRKMAMADLIKRCDELHEKKVSDRGPSNDSPALDASVRVDLPY